MLASWCTRPKGTALIDAIYTEGYRAGAAESGGFADGLRIGAEQLAEQVRRLLDGGEPAA